MKKILICVALACCLTAAAHSNDNDTIVVEKPRRVRIISSDSLQRVEVWGSSTNPSYHYESNIQVVDSNYVSTSALNDNTWNFSFSVFPKQIRAESQCVSVKCDSVQASVMQ